MRWDAGVVSHGLTYCANMPVKSSYAACDGGTKDYLFFFYS